MTATPLQRFFLLLKPDRSEIRNLYVYAFFHGLVYLSLPLGIQAIINLIQGGRVSTSWILLTAVVVAGVAISGILQLFQLRITENLQQKIFARAAFEFTYRIPRIRTEELYRHYAPELMNRFFDVLTVQKGLPKILIDFSVAGFQLLLSIILLSLYHPFFIAFGVLLVVLVGLILLITGRPGLESSLKESKFKYKLVHWLEEIARTSASFKLAGRTELSLERTDRHVADYLGAREKHFSILIRQYSLLVIFKVLIAFGLLAIGGYLVIQQRLNIGQFVAAEIVVLYIMTSAEKIVLTLETIYDVLTGLEKIGQVTDLELESIDGVDLLNTSSKVGLSVELENVSFRYPNGDRDVVSKANLTIEPGEKLVISGANASGKSSLLHLLAGLYDPREGTIMFDGIPKTNLQLDALHNVIGECLAEGLLFEGTIRENIAMGRAGATEENVSWAVDAAGLEEKIRRMPRGYDTIIDPQGEKLPRSTVQRILLARAIADRPRLLLLEEALQHVDEKERRGLIDFLFDPVNPWTLIAVSRDPYFLEKSDRILVMQDGVILNNSNNA